MTLPHVNRRHAARARRGAAGLAAVLAALAVAACGGSSGSTVARLPPVHPDRVGPEATFTPSNSELLGPDVGAKLDLLRQLGVRDVHIGIQWASIAPHPTSRHRPSFDAADPAAYPAGVFAPYDAIDRGLAARGIQFTLALAPSAPIWATGRGHWQLQGVWEPKASEFGQFARALATRYSGHYTPPGQSTPLPRITQWSIWNEPDQGFQLAPQTNPKTHAEQSPAMYRALVDAAWSGLRAAGQSPASILIGELAPAGRSYPTNPGNFGSMAPLRFLRALYCVGSDYKPLSGVAAAQRSCPTTAAASAHFAAQHPGLFHAGGVANHPYPQGLAPNTVTPDEPDYTELAASGKLEATLDRLNRLYGSSTRYRIYSTEFGYQTKPPDDELGVVSPQTAAAWMNWAEYITWQDPRQASFDQYLIVDPPSGHFATGLVTAQGVPKPAYDAYRMPLYLPVTSTRKRHPLVVWGCVRPAYFAQKQTHTPQRVQIQFAPRGSTRFRTLRTVTIASPHGFFETTETFPGSGSVRLRWSYPNGGVITSRTVVVTLR
ncbi:MAG TPA: hypothetical protein VFN55_03460 [Solirubrobacteraceae bacterium]|nr:hypothetical protein [Solirubrobacteraceae bacterium]